MAVWTPVAEKNRLGIAINNFSQDKSHRVELDIGDSVIILKECDKWYYGYNKRNRAIKGIFPKSYVHLVESVKIKNDFVIKHSEIVDEITAILTEWKYFFKKFFLTSNPGFQAIRQKMLGLIKLRAQILSGNLPADALKDIKLLASTEIDTGNKLLGLDMVVRDESGNILDITSTSTTELYDHHMQAIERIRLASNNKNRLSKTMNKHSHNVLLSVHNFISKVNDDTELLFALYDGDEMKAITESYVIKWNRTRMSLSSDQYNNSVLFTDLSTQDLNRNKTYLIAYIVRIGMMDVKDSDSKRLSHTLLNTKKSNRTSTDSLSTAEQMRRPFGVAAFDLTPILKSTTELRSDSQMQMIFLQCEKENLESTLRKLITSKDTSKCDSSIWISLDLLHGDIKQVKEDNPHLMKANVPFARKMGFPEVIFPGDVRNDLYVTMLEGEFTKGKKTSDKNVEVTACVCNEKGIVMQDLIAKGAANMVSEFKSVIYYHEDRPKWHEIFKVDVPIEDFKQCHLRFTFKHRSTNETKDRTEKPFGLSYVKLCHENGTTIQDKLHKLLVYKIDHKKYEDTQYNYLQLPAVKTEVSSNVKAQVAGFSVFSKDSFTIGTNLCSTKLTQDVDLLGLLNSTNHNSRMWENLDEMENSLKSLMDVKPEEVVKFLQDILDVLFDILVNNPNPERFDNLVFKCLLRLIEIVSDLKYQHFLSVLDLYINESFASTLAYEKIINVLQTQIKNAINSIPSTDELSEETPEKLLYKIMKHLQYIMKFIIQSRLLFAKLNDNKDHMLFEASLEDLLGSFVTLIASPKEMLLSQGAILKCLHVIAADLLQVYDPVKLSKVLVTIITTIPAGRLSQSKMICIKDLVDSKIFRLSQCRAVLLPVFCKQIKDKLESKEEGDLISDIWQQEKNLTKAAKVLGEKKSHLHQRETIAKTKAAECVNIMSKMLDLLFQKDIGNTDNDIKEIMLILLRTVIQSSIAMDPDNPLVGHLVAIMLGIFRSMNAGHYKIYVEHFAATIDLQDFLTEILHVFKSLVSRSAFPSDWMDMIMHQNTVILESLQYFSNIIVEYFFDQFEQQVWSNFFHCSIEFLTQPALQLDQFSANKKSTILSRYRDIRRETAFEIRKMWFNLGEHKIQFIPQLVGSILEMSMIPELEIRKVTIPIFFDMMQCEFYSSRYYTEMMGDTKRKTDQIRGNFSEFEKEMFQKLDILVEGGKGDHEYKEMFHDILMDHCTQHNTLRHDGVSFVTTACTLMERLLEYRYIIHDESKENRMACTMSLLQFYSNVNRKEMYIRYVYKLCDLHMEFENYTEAAYTLKLHSNLLHWDDSPLTQQLRSNRHLDLVTHRQLKIQLYNEIIENFNHGKMWECALELCKEMAQQFEEVTFDYANLSQIYTLMSTFYQKILTEMRHESEYFRVSFYGNGFPDFLRNKVFIYRGKEYERLGSFCTRILSQHPTAELMQTLTAPGPEITESDGQYIQINSVEPLMDENYRRFSEKVVANPIMKYYQTNNVQKFKFSRPFRDKSGGDPESVANLWLERTIILTTDPLPGILRWFPVKCSDTFRISPIEYAIETMEATNKAIKDIIINHRNDPNLPINPLSMKINGIVDAAVMGGFAKYEEAFLTDQYVDQHPRDRTLVEKLKDLIASQVPLLEIAISVHRSKAPPNLMPFQERLEKCFNEMQISVETKYGKRTSDLKIDKDASVVLRRPSNLVPQISLDANRLSETSLGSSDSGCPKTTPRQSSVVNTSNIIQKFRGQNFGTMKSNKKRRSSQAAESENARTLHPMNSNSIWYGPSIPGSSTTVSLPPVAGTPPEKEPILINNSISTVYELTQELTTQRPLRSDIEREKRLSRTASSCVSSPIMRNTAGGDNISISGESSNRNSTITTDSTTSEEDNLSPPPLPVKTRDSNDYSNVPINEAHNLYAMTTRTSTNKPLPPIPGASNNSYEYLEIKKPPTPPPKPSRNSKIK